MLQSFDHSPKAAEIGCLVGRQCVARKEWPIIGVDGQIGKGFAVREELIRDQPPDIDQSFECLGVIANPPGILPYFTDIRVSRRTLARVQRFTNARLNAHSRRPFVLAQDLLGGLEATREGRAVQRLYRRGTQRDARLAGLRETFRAEKGG